MAYLKGGETYDSAFITVDALSTDVASRDKAVAAVTEPETSTEEKPETPKGGSSSGGCDSGFGLFALLTFALFGMKRK